MLSKRGSFPAATYSSAKYSNASWNLQLACAFAFALGYVHGSIPSHNDRFYWRSWTVFCNNSFCRFVVHSWHTTSRLCCFLALDEDTINATSTKWLPYDVRAGGMANWPLKDVRGPLLWGAMTALRSPGDVLMSECSFSCGLGSLRHYTGLPADNFTCFC